MRIIACWIIVGDFDQDFTVLEEFARGGMKKIVKVHDKKNENNNMKMKSLEFQSKENLLSVKDDLGLVE